MKKVKDKDVRDCNAMGHVYPKTITYKKGDQRSRKSRFKKTISKS
jgi:hypothetical protein